ncbi:ATP-dependent DNA helicase UvrD2 [Microlunatus parietis]|uniref:DNA 3'-5' helicase n=1 Tax=Microlunatus parietis TaxID=682979 RepID=A0A7Y9IEF7_9ACTN|nr:ATP-dependent DNA helicase UvrD2 [Microlunatus parietis]NYE75265.1 DNA helicase-2/ATP-dependent DNA helicase PcrA [Microlunatus parietis]
MAVDPDRLLAALDPEQQEVATTLRGPVAVIAGAGTGKTRAITHRIAYGVATGVYRPTAVLAVTFTQRAAGELRGRLQELGVPGVQARTFHSAALRQAQYFWPKVYGGELPAVLDHRMGAVADAAGRLRVAVDTPKLRDLVGEIAWAKVSNVGPEDYAQVAAARHRGLASFDHETVARVFAGYEEVKRERGRIDFEDILLCAAALISDNPEVADQVRGTYRHLVVDEYQDVSPLQQALLDLWRGERTDLCVVGDPAQTIHSFAGAQADFLTGFARRHPGATVIRLVRDYRSTPEVVGVANAIMDAAPAGGGRGELGAVTLVAQQPSGPAVEYAEAASESAEASGIADWLRRLADAGIAYREMAVLFRINAQSPPIEQALAEAGIPYLVRGGERFYERPEVRQALLQVRTEARTLDGADDGVSGADRLKALFAALGWTPEPPSGAGAVRERWESLAALVAVAEDLTAAAGGPVGLAAISAELERRAEAQQVPAAQGVTLSTLHSAKGLEWDAVALYGIQEGSLPFVLADTPAQLAEERRLLYVGVTRARRRLRVSWARTRNGGGAVRKPSRFLGPVLPSADRRAPRSGGSTGNRRSELSARCRSCGRPLSGAAERKLGRHTDCPSTYDEATLEALKAWRKEAAAEQGVPAYCVFTDATLVAIAEARPATPADLIKIHGLGLAKAKKYGPEVLAVLADSAPGTSGSAGPDGDLSNNLRLLRKEFAPAADGSLS